jgi:hypothetical protein
MTLLELLKTLFKRGSAGVEGARAELPASSPARYPDSVDEPAQICNPKVLLICMDPVMDVASGRRLSADRSWHRPDDLVGRFIADVLQASGGLVRYQIAERAVLDEFPALADGFRYDAAGYLQVLERESQPHSPSTFDYGAILDRFDVLPQVARRRIDEVWLMGFPHAGLYESIMGGADAFWCNAPALKHTESCQRRFVVMGFSFERDLGEMLHSYNHRAEAILAHVFASLGFLTWAYKPDRHPATISEEQDLNLFEQFMLFDQIAPGRAGIGSVHHPPNAARDYDLGNPRLVASSCYDWLGFPAFRGDVRMISAAEWGDGSELSYQRWWMKHLPKAAGRSGGVHQNWWQYIANLDNVID